PSLEAHLLADFLPSRMEIPEARPEAAEFRALGGVIDFDHHAPVATRYKHRDLLPVGFPGDMTASGRQTDYHPAACIPNAPTREESLAVRAITQSPYSRMSI